MKILYAVNNRKGGQLQLARFLSFNQDNWQIKIAGHNKSCPAINLDWTLDALQNMFDLEHVSFDNDNLRTYYEQVKSFAPDLIISDLEVYTSYIGNQLGIPVWQVSPSLLYYGVDPLIKSEINVFKHYSYLFNRQNATDNILHAILGNSDRKLIPSHFGDAGSVKLNQGYEWIRPYHISGKESVPCQHNVCAATLQNDKAFINYLKSFKDVVLFSNNLDESYSGITLKDISKIEEYGCNLKNCIIGATQGYTDLLADLYYAGKYSLVFPDFTQGECVTNALLTEHLGLGKAIYKNELFEVNEIIPNLNSNIKYLHDEIRKM